ncbi:MAG: SDR family oxidoreductase [Betaproteobacteria bacterium]|nr:SDR family oxidoreductase [Betaproteobacteria bacterium]
MRVLLTGANGFIGRHLLAGLKAAGHDVTAAVRDPDALRRPDLTTMQVDFNRDTDAVVWTRRLAGFDAVINCAGVLQSARGQSAQAIHAAAPIALFEGAKLAGVRRVIQISAISAEPGAGTEYADTKLAADEHLKRMDLDWVIVRPSLVVASGAFGGTALLRALAASPFRIPLVGAGEQRFQPIQMSDVVACVVNLLANIRINKQVLDPVGPDVVTLRQLLVDYRAWLGFAPVPCVRIPMLFVRSAARIGDVLGGPLSTTALKQMAFGNVGDHARYVDATGLHPISWKHGLNQHPAQWQDRWHARLYFLRPALRLALALMWLISGLVGFGYSPDLLSRMAASTGWATEALRIFAIAGCIADLLLGVLILARWRPPLLAGIQIALIAGYTAFLTWALPGLWMDPFGPLLKNLPIMAAIAIWAALEQDR